MTVGNPLAGHVCLLTGGTGGIGKAVAVDLARQGVTLAIVGHNPDKGRSAADEIRQAAATNAVRYLCADLSVMDEVHALADRVEAEFDRLDILINHAGVARLHREITDDGFEMTWAVNHLAPFLLTNRLLPMLMASAPARILVTTSESHRYGRIHWGDPNLAAGYNVLRAYRQSKLANLLFTYELARRLQGTGITANAVHPGFVDTQIGRGLGGIAGLGWGLVARLLGKSPEEGAEPLVYLATAPEAATVTGAYYDPNGPRHSVAASYDMKDASRLWELSARQTGLTA